MPVVIAIDGPAASGKGTLARKLAEILNFAHLDSGKIYRAVARDMVDLGADLDDPDSAERAADHVDLTSLADPRLSRDDIGHAASRIAAIPAVRQALLGAQRDFAAAPPDGKSGVVIDGRDIGTVICPEAAVKLFIDADVENRARRRWNELRDRGESAIYAAVLQEMKERDTRDASRDVSPMAPAPDAFRVDTTEMDAEAAFAAVLRIVHSKLGRVRHDQNMDTGPNKT